MLGIGINAQAIGSVDMDREKNRARAYGIAHAWPNPLTNEFPKTWNSVTYKIYKQLYNNVNKK